MRVAENFQTHPRKVTGNTVGPQKPIFLQESVRLYWNFQGRGSKPIMEGVYEQFLEQNNAILSGPNTTNLRLTLIPMFLLLTLDMFLAR